MHKNKVMSQLICETTGWLCREPFEMRGDVQLLEGIIPGGGTPGQGPSFRILQEDQKVTARFNWECFGSIVNSQSFKCHWHLGLHFENIGDGPTMPTKVVNVRAVPDPGGSDFLSPGRLDYDWNLGVLFDKPSLDPNMPAHPGTYVYRAVATITLFKGEEGDPHGGPLPVTAFTDLGLFEVYCAT